jgi:hypothetical protein
MALERAGVTLRGYAAESDAGSLAGKRLEMAAACAASSPEMGVC